MLLIAYPKCSTCKKAQNYLDEHQLSYEYRDIKNDKLSYDELNDIVSKYHVEIKKLFNTSGILYRELGLKDKLSSMNDDEKIKLLASNGMLVKRPLLITDDELYIGFMEKAWEKLI